jgi:hypothetical protein
MKTAAQLFALSMLLSCGLKSNQEAKTSAVVESDPAPSADAPTDAPDNNCLFDNEVSTLGIGLVLAPAEFTLFNDSALTEIYAEVDMYADDEGLDLICPKFFAPEYSILNFVCLDSSSTSYKVLSGYSTVKYLKRVDAAEFMSWHDYVLSSFGIRRLTSNDGAELSNQPLKREPFQQSPTLKIPAGFEMFCPMEIKEDWVKIKYDCFYNLEQNPHEGEPCHNFIGECEKPLTGWMRWRDGNRLLIDILLAP